MLACMKHLMKIGPTGPDPEGALAGGGRPSKAAERGPWDPGAVPRRGSRRGSKLLNCKHLYRWNHAILAANQQQIILAANQQNLLEKFK